MPQNPRTIVRGFFAERTCFFDKIEYNKGVHTVGSRNQRVKYRLDGRLPPGEGTLFRDADLATA